MYFEASRNQPASQPWSAGSHSALGKRLIRFAISALILLPFALRTKPWTWTRTDQGLAVLAAGLGDVGYNLPVTFGQVHVPAGVTALIIATEPLWILLLWPVASKTLPSRPMVIGSALGLGGILVLLAPQLVKRGQSASMSGIALVALGALAWSAYCITLPGLIQRHGTLAVTAVTVIIGGLPLLCAAEPGLPDTAAKLTPEIIGVILVLSVGSTVLATLTWNYATGVLPGPTSGQFLYALPLVGVVAGWLLLDEQISLGMLVAAVLIFAGLLLAQAKT